MKEPEQYKEGLIRQGLYYKGKAEAYESILRSCGLLEGPKILRFDSGKTKETEE